MTSLPTYPVRLGRTRGPIVAVKDGTTGLSYPCGHFQAGLPVATEGAKVREALSIVGPCPTCWPLGRLFHDKVFGHPMVVGGAK